MKSKTKIKAAAKTKTGLPRGAVKAIAEKLGRSINHVWYVARGERSGKVIEAAIAEYRAVLAGKCPYGSTSLATCPWSDKCSWFNTCDLIYNS